MFTLNDQYADTSPLPFDWLARIASIIARFWSDSRRKRYVPLISAELRALDDRMLKDIGLQRYQIESALLYGQGTDWYAPLAGMNYTERHNNDDI
jgi:uncharacterized protein YjiS (DUF1127 family)